MWEDKLRKGYGGFVQSGDVREQKWDVPAAIPQHRRYTCRIPLPTLSNV